MVCIAAFIILAILGIFSANYRPLAKKAWGCVIKRVTFKPCDVKFGDEIKNKLLGKLILTKPRLAKFLDKWLNVLSFIFVALTIWSLWTVLISGLNLFVYDTCNPQSVESCSLGGESCGVNAGGLGFIASVKEGEVLTWAKDSVIFFGSTITRIPDRLKTWQTEDYVTEKNTYLKPFDPTKPTALEIIDPGCHFCGKLYGNILEANFADKYNLTYILYPITNKEAVSGYKFQHSYLVASYVEAVKLLPLKNATTTADWQLLDKMYTLKTDNGGTYQDQFNLMYSKDEAEQVLGEWLLQIGYNTDEIIKIQLLAKSDEVKDSLARQKVIVEKQIRTIKIPTIMFDGRRYDRVIGVEKLR